VILIVVFALDGAASPVRWLQPRLFETGKDFTRFGEDSDADLQNPWLIWAIYLARRRGEARGWTHGIRLGVRRALIIVLSGHAAGDTVCYSEIFPALRARDISVERAAEVLQEMGVLADDRRPSFEGWLERKLEGLAEGIGREAGSWLQMIAASLRPAARTVPARRGIPPADSPAAAPRPAAPTRGHRGRIPATAACTAERPAPAGPPTRARRHAPGCRRTPDPSASA
jgi:hypothetical protein